MDTTGKRIEMTTPEIESGLYFQNPNRKAYYSPYAKLMRACWNGDAIAVGYILDRMEDGRFSDDENIDGLYVEQVTSGDLESYGDTPLSVACSHGHSEVVEVLLRRGANPNVTPPSGITPLQDAIDADSVSIVILLLKYGADLEERCQVCPEDGGYDEVSPLEYARLCESDSRIIELLSPDQPKLSVVK